MIKVSTLAIAGGSVLMAVGAGIYMQMSGSGSETAQIAALGPAPDAVGDSMTQEAVDPGQTPLDLDRITLTSVDLPPVAAPAWVGEDLSFLARSDLDNPAAPPDPMAPMLASIEEDTLMIGPAPAPAPETDQVLVVDSCTVDLTGENRAAAMVALRLVAPCQPDARVTFRHEGMVFSALTDAEGKVEVTVPALSMTASFLAMLEDGNGAAVELEVDTLGFYDRSVVQWQGNAGIELHAFEYGAAWEEDGHVWSGAPRDAVIAARGEGGFLSRLGDATLEDGHVAEVYTFPTGTAKTAGDISLTVEIEVTDLNCGQALKADVIEVTDALPGKPAELTLTVPGCEAVGDFIQLKNLVQDLKIAAR